MHGFSMSKKKATETANRIGRVTTALMSRPGIKLTNPLVRITIPVRTCNIGRWIR